MERKVRKSPSPGIETGFVVDEQRVEQSRPAFAHENRLSAIGVAQPLVQYHYPGKAERICQLCQLAFRQMIIDFRPLVDRMERISGTKVKAAPARIFGAIHLNSQLRRVLDEPCGNFDGIDSG